MNVRLLKAIDSSVVTCGCDSWTVKTAEHQGIDTFDLCGYRRLLTVPWAARRGATNEPAQVTALDPRLDLLSTS